MQSPVIVDGMAEIDANLQKRKEALKFGTKVKKAVEGRLMEEEVLTPEFAAEYERLGRKKDLDEKKVRELVKRHAVVLLGKIKSVNEFKSLVELLSDLSGWKKSAEHKASSQRDDDLTEEDTKKFKDMLEN